MRGAVMYGAGDVRVEDVPDARLLDPTDALVRVTRAAICGSDLWLYKSMPQDAYPTLSSIEESPVQAVYDEAAVRVGRPDRAAIARDERAHLVGRPRWAQIGRLESAAVQSVTHDGSASRRRLRREVGRVRDPKRVSGDCEVDGTLRAGGKLRVACVSMDLRDRAVADVPDPDRSVACGNRAWVVTDDDVVDVGVIWASIAVRRSPSSRAISACANGASAKSASAGPRQSASASLKSAAAFSACSRLAR